LAGLNFSTLRMRGVSGVLKFVLGLSAPLSCWPIGFFLR